MIRHILVVHPSVGGHCSWFPLWATVTIANTFRYKFYVGSVLYFLEHSPTGICVNVFSFLGYISRRGIVEAFH